ncbi:MAG: hypothetical protein QXF89_01755, partial [Candidatus Caldarchaeum sp.]
MEQPYLFLVTEVARRLRLEGVKCGTAETIDAYRAGEFVQMRTVQDLKNVLRLCMVKRLEDYEIFDKIFDELEKQKRPQEQPKNETQGDKAQAVKTVERGESSADKRKEMTVYYSPVEVFMKRELPTPTLAFMRESKRVMKRLRRRLALLPGRRYTRSAKGYVDFRE